MVMGSEPALHGAGHASALISWLEKYLDTSIELPLLDPQVARELRLRNRLRVVLPVVDELDRHHLGCPDERTAGSFFGHDVDPIAECRGAYGPESPHPLVGVAEIQQQIVLLSIRERDDDLHRPRRLR